MTGMHPSIRRRAVQPPAKGDRELGRRIRKYRERLGLSREVLAQQVGRSKGWLLKVENGRSDPPHSSLVLLAERLGVEVAVFFKDEDTGTAVRHERASHVAGTAILEGDGRAQLDPSAAGTTPAEWLEEMRRRAFLQAIATVTGATALRWWPLSDQPASMSSPVVALREALLDHDARPGTGAPPDLATLRRSVHDLWAAFQGARYEEALTAMPDVLRRGQRAVHMLDGEDRLTATMLLAQTYQAISTFMRKVGDINLATLAADRAMAAAYLHGSSVTIAESARFLCLILGDTGNHHQAIKICSAAVDRFESEVHHPDPTAISIYGQLVLAGAEAAASGGDVALARNFFQEANGTGRRLGHDANHSFTAFGPTNIAVHQVHAAVVLGDGETAIRQAKNIDLGRLPVLERRAHHLLDVGLGYNLIGRPEDAAVSLLTAEQLAAEEIRYDPLARLLAEQLRHRVSSVNAQLDALVGRMPPLLS